LLTALGIKMAAVLLGPGGRPRPNSCVTSRQLLTTADIYYILYIEVQDAEETSFVH